MKILVNQIGIPIIWDQNDLEIITCAICDKKIPSNYLNVKGEDLLPHIKCSSNLIQGSDLWN